MLDINDIAQKADVIVSGYALTRKSNEVSVFNLNNKKSVAIITVDGTLISTNMDDIELSIAKKYVLQNLKYMDK